MEQKAAPERSRQSREILGMRVDATSYEDATERTLAWVDEASSRYVCIANVHMVMEAFDSEAYRAIVNGADLVTPDGVPLVWSLRVLGVSDPSRVYGPELMPRLLEAADRRGLAVGFYGGAQETLDTLLRVVTTRYPSLPVAYACSPPFRPLTPAEDQAIVDDIVDAGVQLLFVGLGCPKQERWMAEHRGRIPSVMFGVGAAFDFLAGAKAQAPGWMQRRGLEWVFRLLTEPRRLWRRYLKHNPRFVWHFTRQLAGTRLGK